MNRILGTWDGFGQGLTSGNEARLCVLNKLEGIVLRLENIIIQQLVPYSMFSIARKVTFRTYSDSLLVVGAYDAVRADWSMLLIKAGAACWLLGKT